VKERALERFAAPQDPVEMASFGSTRIASEYCQVRVGGDAAALKGIMKLALEADVAARSAGKPSVLDTVFIAEHTDGFEAFAADLRQTAWDDILATSGLPREQLERVAWIYMQSKAVIACYGMGSRSIGLAPTMCSSWRIYYFWRGNIGRPGAGICPVRGHSNVQGDRTVGIDEKPKPEFLDRLGRAFGLRSTPRRRSQRRPRRRAMLDDRVKVFIGMGGNFVAAVPDKPMVEGAMRKLRLTVGVTTKLNRGHLVHGREALILPCLARSEIDFQKSGPQSVTVEDSMSMGTRRAGCSRRAASTSNRRLPSSAAWRGYSDGQDGRLAVVQDDYDLIRDKIEEVFPDLFKEFNAKVSADRRLSPGQRRFGTGLANLTVRLGFSCFAGSTKIRPAHIQKCCA